MAENVTNVIAIELLAAVKGYVYAERAPHLSDDRMLVGDITAGRRSRALGRPCQSVEK